MEAGGFDCVIGNPPWDRIKLQEQEFFAARDPDIAAAPNKAARGKSLIDVLSRSAGWVIQKDACIMLGVHNREAYCRGLKRLFLHGHRTMQAVLATH